MKSICGICPIKKVNTHIFLKSGRVTLNRYNNFFCLILISFYLMIINISACFRVAEPYVRILPNFNGDMLPYFKFKFGGLIVGRKVMSVIRGAYIRHFTVVSHYVYIPPDFMIFNI